MENRRNKRLVRDEESSQRTEKGLEVPERSQVFGALDKASK
jgi:hypothetical protein